VLPFLVTGAAWQGCDHLGPVHEGDTLRGTISVEQVEPLPDVLDWRCIAVVA
jgi:acyl dehydratase